MRFLSNRVSAAIALTLLLGGTPLHSQLFTGSINGLVSDPNGSAVPAAQLTITNASTAGARKVTSDSAGHYSVTQLQPGTYSISVTATGFETSTVTNIVLQASQNLEYNLALVIGSVTQQIDVTGAAPVLDTEDANKSVTLTSQQALDLPIPTHNSLGPVWSQNGVVAVRTGATSNPTQGDQNMSRFAMNGGRDESTAVLVDGVSVTSGDWGGAMGIPSIESVQEFQVLKNTFDVQYGKTDGGVVDLVTKSGSDKFHGGGFEYLQNADLNANTWTNNLSHLPKTAYRLNQFGGHLGGPVLQRKRLFFFGNYDGIRQGQPSNDLTTVPTALQKQGDFSQTYNSNGTLAVIYNPFTTVQNGSTYARTPFPNNMIPSSLLNPSGVMAANLFPAPNLAGNPITGANNFAAGGIGVNRYDRMDLRFDWVATDKWSVFGTFERLWSLSGVPTFLGPGLDTNYTSPNTSWRGLINLTYVPSPTWVLNFVIATDTWNQEQLSPSLSANINGSKYGFPQSLLNQFSAPTLPDVTIENYSSIGYDRRLLYGICNTVTMRKSICRRDSAVICISSDTRCRFSR